MTQHDSNFRFSVRKLLIGAAVAGSLAIAVACWSEAPEAIPTTEPTAAAAADTPVLPTPVVDLAAGSVTGTPEAEAAAVVESTPTVTPTLTSEPAGSTTSPLQIVDERNCPIESHIDLAGYPLLEDEMGCPVAEASTAPIGINEFGPGPDYDRFMLWFSSEQQIYVLLPDGVWEVHPDTWQEGDPTYSCNPLEGTTPFSPPLPRRGFSKVWCSSVELQETMGLVELEERLCQHTVLQEFAIGRLIACFEDATIRYFRLLNDNTWDVLVQ
jgi:hypothetical protein